MIKKSIYLLHTADVHLQRFEPLIAPYQEKIDFHQTVHKALLDKAEKIGGISEEITEETKTTLTNLVDQGADAILITCSTLGGIASNFPKIKNCPIYRIDDILAEEALKLGKHLAIICAVQSTIEPTRQLFVQKAKELGKVKSVLDVHFVPESWDHFKSGNFEKYAQSIANYVRQNTQTADIIVLAQASMDKVPDYLDHFDRPILCSPELGVKSLISTFK